MLVRRENVHEFQICAKRLPVSFSQFYGRFTQTRRQVLSHRVSDHEWARIAGLGFVEHRRERSGGWKREPFPGDSDKHVSVWEKSRDEAGGA